MTWTWQKFEEILEGFGPIEREIATSDKGVVVEPWGTQGACRQILFKYNDEDITVEFAARRSSRNITELHAIDNDVTYPLGPICQVWFDDRRMTSSGRPLSEEQRAAIEATFTEFLTTAFRDCSYAVPPYAEQVEFY